MSEHSRTRIALISATLAAIAPATEAVRRHFSDDVEICNIVDDRLLADAQGGMTEELTERMRRLIDYAVTSGADGVLLTCSLYGSVAREAEVGVPVHGPDDAALAAVVDGAFDRVLVLASVEAALEDTSRRLEAALSEATVGTRVDGAWAPRVLGELSAGAPDQLVAVLEEACAPWVGVVDAVLLAQYSLAPFAPALAASFGRPVFSGPDAAAAHLRQSIDRAAT